MDALIARVSACPCVNGRCTRTDCQCCTNLKALSSTAAMYEDCMRHSFDRLDSRVQGRVCLCLNRKKMFDV